MKDVSESSEKYEDYVILQNKKHKSLDEFKKLIPDSPEIKKFGFNQNGDLTWV